MSDVSSTTVTAEWAESILAFWFEEVGASQWWVKSEATDEAIVTRFRARWEALRGAPADAFLDRADEALAAIILFDQFPRNMFRGEARAFATDPLARDIARGALARGYDVQTGGAGQIWFYLPFQHSEDAQDQALSLSLFEALGDQDGIDSARKHHAMIEKYGRFPHRNAALGRADRPGEQEAIAQGAKW